MEILYRDPNGSMWRTHAFETNRRTFYFAIYATCASLLSKQIDEHSILQFMQHVHPSFAYDEFLGIAPCGLESKAMIVKVILCNKGILNYTG
jgi:hypothetical protein